MIAMTAIAAVDSNWGIGYQGQLQYRISEDLRRFKALTTGNTIVMGHSTLLTFPGGKPLPNRTNLILSRNKNLHIEGAQVLNSIEALLAAVKTIPGNIFVVGGQSIYQQLLPYCDTAYITKIHHSSPADAWFPNLDLDKDNAWQLTEQSETKTENSISYSYCLYTRRQNV